MKQDLSALIMKMSKEDPWTLRQIGREASITMIKQMRTEAKTQTEQILWDKMLKSERNVIKAAKQRNQADWDFYNQEISEIAAQIKATKALTA